MDALIDRQVEERDLMSHVFTNLRKKRGQASRGAIESRLTALEKKWSLIETRQEKIMALKTADNENIDYFKENFLAEAEDVFLEE